MLPAAAALRYRPLWPDATAETSIRACHKEGMELPHVRVHFINRVGGQWGCQDGDCSSIGSRGERNEGAITPPLQLWLISASWACASLKSPPDMKHVVILRFKFLCTRDPDGPPKKGWFSFHQKILFCLCVL